MLLKGAGFSVLFLCLADFNSHCPCLVPIVDIDAHSKGEEVVEYVYPVKNDQ